LGSNIEHHDFELKKEAMRKFLEKNHPVKLIIQTKKSSFLKNEGRPQRNLELLARLATDLAEFIEPSKTKQDPKSMPGSVVKFFYPKSKSSHDRKAA